MVPRSARIFAPPASYRSSRMSPGVPATLPSRRRQQSSPAFRLASIPAPRGHRQLVGSTATDAAPPATMMVWRSQTIGKNQCAHCWRQVDPVGGRTMRQFSSDIAIFLFVLAGLHFDPSHILYIYIYPHCAFLHSHLTFHHGTFSFSKVHLLFLHSKITHPRYAFVIPGCNVTVTFDFAFLTYTFYTCSGHLPGDCLVVVAGRCLNLFPLSRLLQ